MNIMVVHLGQFLSLSKTGMALFAEQCIESAHSDFRKTLKRFGVDECHSDHPKRLKRAVVEYSSRRL